MNPNNIPSIQDLIRKQKSLFPSPESVEFLRTVQHKLTFDELEKWMHEGFEKAQRDKDIKVMKQMSMTNDLLSNIIIQYTMDRYPGRIVWIDPATGLKAE